MEVMIKYVNGPRDGELVVKQMKAPPKMIGCVDDAHAKGMHGVYKLRDEVYVWEEIKK